MMTKNLHLQNVGAFCPANVYQKILLIGFKYLQILSGGRNAFIFIQ